MSNVVNPSPDLRVNQHCIVYRKAKKVEVIHYINLYRGENDLDDAFLQSLRTYSPGTDVYYKICKEFKLDFSHIDNPPTITIFRYAQCGKPTGSDIMITFPKERSTYILEKLPHVIIAIIAPTGGTASTSLEEAL